MRKLSEPLLLAIFALSIAFLTAIILPTDDPSIATIMRLAETALGYSLSHLEGK